MTDPARLTRPEGSQAVGSAPKSCVCVVEPFTVSIQPEPPDTVIIR